MQGFLHLHDALQLYCRSALGLWHLVESKDLIQCDTGRAKRMNRQLLAG